MKELYNVSVEEKKEFGIEDRLTWFNTFYIKEKLKYTREQCLPTYSL